MEIKKFNSEDELSSMRFSCADEAILGVKNLFFNDQLLEENILLDIYSTNGIFKDSVDLRRLNIDRVFSKKQITNKYLFKRYRLIDSVKYQEDYSVQTILEIKNEQKRLDTTFKNYFTLLPSNSLIKLKQEPLLFVQVDKNIFYLINDFLLDEQEAKHFNFKSIISWIKNKIFTKTSSK